MRNLIPILLAVVVLSSGCDPDGYSCNSEGCYAENNAQYLTLEDCLSVCDEQVPGGCGSGALHEGYNYSTVQIGDQCWFSENCRYLPEVSPSGDGSETEPYYYVYDYQGTGVADAKATENYDSYGVLYNWPAVMTEGICPSGWHIPTDGEFTELINFLGGDYVAGGKMKEAGYDHWSSPNEGATNSSGWTGLPGGFCGTGGFDNNGYGGSWWSASEAEGSSLSGLRYLDYNSGGPNFQAVGLRSVGFSARCVRD